MPRTCGRKNGPGPGFAGPGRTMLRKRGTDRSGGDWGCHRYHRRCRGGDDLRLGEKVVIVEVVHPQEAQDGDVVGAVEGEVERRADDVVHEGEDDHGQGAVGDRQPDGEAVVAPRRAILRQPLDKRRMLQLAALPAQV